MTFNFPTQNFIVVEITIFISKHHVHEMTELKFETTTVLH